MKEFLPEILQNKRLLASATTHEFSSNASCNEFPIDHDTCELRHGGATNLWMKREKNQLSESRGFQSKGFNGKVNFCGQNFVRVFGGGPRIMCAHVVARYVRRRRKIVPRDLGSDGCSRLATDSSGKKIINHKS